LPSINTYFSQKDNLQEIILKNLDNAAHTVNVAVAWFTDVKLFNKLIEVQSKGAKVELIITKHQFNDESHNHYNLIKENGGVFIEIGGDYSTMHHKFCIIDHKTLLQGSFNWTKKANESNNETLLVIKDDYQSINEFTEEFERLKRLAGLESERHQLEIAKALKYFTLIKTFIDLDKINEINPYLHEIKNIEELKSAVDLLFKGEYEKAVVEMDLLSKRFTTLINVSVLEKEELVFKIRLLSEQIKQIEVEKTEIEEQVDNFNRRYILELNPLIASIIQLKKKIYEKLKKLGIVDETFEQLRQEYEKVREELEREEEKNVPDLNQDEQKDLKKMYHEASTLCHPDSSKCVIKDKKKAEELFSALSSAYKAKDFAKVKDIYEELKSGIFNPENLMDNEVDKLKIKLAALEHKYNTILNNLRILKTTDPFLTFKDLKDWNQFFEIQKVVLQNQKEELELKYVKS
jgi:hypothetical protein